MTKLENAYAMKDLYSLKINVRNVKTIKTNVY